MPNLVTPEAVQITLDLPRAARRRAEARRRGGRPRGLLPALVRNQSGIVDNYEIQVKGMPDEWWNVTPPSVYLVPFGAPSGTYEQEVQINFNPPRSAEAEARIWEIEVVAVSRAQSEVAGSTPSKVQITPYEEIESELRPELVDRPAPRRVRADGAEPRERAARHRDHRRRHPERARTFDFEKPRFVAEPGRRDGTTFIGQGEEAPLDRPPDRPALRDLRARPPPAQSTRGRSPAPSARSRGSRTGCRSSSRRSSPAAVLALLADPAQDDRPEPARPERRRGARSSSRRRTSRRRARRSRRCRTGTSPRASSSASRRRPARTSRTDTVVTFTVAEPLVPNLLGKTRRRRSSCCSRRASLLGSPARAPKISKKKPGLDHRAAAREPARTCLTGKTRSRSSIAIGNEPEEGAERRRLDAPGGRSRDHGGRAHRGSAVALARARIRPR